MFKDTEYLKGCLSSLYKNKYDMSDIVYVDDAVPVKLVCPKHGAFWDSPIHLISSRKGCPHCWNYQSSGEVKIREILDEYSFKYEQEKTLPYLEYKMPLYFDFYLPEQNIAIEFQGPQHFKAIDFFGGQKAFEDQKIRDQIKRDWCKVNNVRLIEVEFHKDIFEQLKDLIDEQLDTTFLSEF